MHAPGPDPAEPSGAPRRGARPHVAVAGPGDATPEQERVARAVGAGLARLGAVVVTGGLGGVMAAVARGCAEAGGTAVGLLPGTDRAAGNPWLAVAVPTGLGEARDALVATAGDVLVVVGGSWGTLAETALAARRGVPVVVVGPGTWDVVADGTDAGETGALMRVATADAAVAEVARLLGPPSPYSSA